MSSFFFYFSYFLRVVIVAFLSPHTHMSEINKCSRTRNWFMGNFLRRLHENDNTSLLLLLLLLVRIFQLRYDFTVVSIVCCCWLFFFLRLLHHFVCHFIVYMKTGLHFWVRKVSWNDNKNVCTKNKNKNIMRKERHTHWTKSHFFLVIQIQLQIMLWSLWLHCFMLVNCCRFLCLSKCLKDFSLFLLKTRRFNDIESSHFSTLFFSLLGGVTKIHSTVNALVFQFTVIYSYNRLRREICNGANTTRKKTESGRNGP